MKAVRRERLMSAMGEGSRDLDGLEGRLGCIVCTYNERVEESLYVSIPVSLLLSELLCCCDVVGIDGGGGGVVDGKAR
jgi:hypothetical protein